MINKFQVSSEIYIMLKYLIIGDTTLSTMNSLTRKRYILLPPHWVAEEVDRGVIVKTREISIEKHDTAYSLWSKSVDSALILLEEVFSILAKEKAFPLVPPVGDGGKYYSKNIAPFKKVSSTGQPQIISKWARAFYFPPNEPAYIEYEGRKVYVLPDDGNY